MKLTELHKQLIKAQRELDDHLAEAAAQTESLKSGIAKIKKDISLNAGGLDADQIAVARSVFRFSGIPTKIVNGAYSDHNRSAVRAKAISDAIARVIENPGWFDKKYIGVKNYDGFGDQREDHENGMGPRHGNIVFSVRKISRGVPLTEAETEAVIYFLSNWAEIVKAEKSAEVA